MAVREAWEEKLVSLTRQAIETSERFPEVRASPVQLQQAFEYCRTISRRHSRTFHLASALLPPAKRKAARSLYAFCRLTDDIVDQARPSALGDLERWSKRALNPAPPADDLVPLAWAASRATYRIPSQYARQLIAGVARDLTETRYASFDDLAEYCYGVASTVGLMSMHIIGFTGPEAIPYAVKMGVALQMTNILRDVGEDWQRGRVYLPQDEMASFGVTEEQIANGEVNDPWRRLMRFQIERTRRLYEESWPGIARLHRDGQFAIAAAADLYGAILEAIEASDSDVFRYRAHISTAGKIARIPGIWLRLRRLRRQFSAA